ncbi:PilV Tfp pilus assembly protein PilV [Methylophilaceae bacterium]
MIKAKPSATTQQGAILLESLIAMLIFSMGILALVGLQAAMVSNTSDAKYRSLASHLAQQKLGELWADPTHIAAITEPVALAELPNGQYTMSHTAASGEVRITITWQAPGDTAVHNITTNARIKGAIKNE